MKKSNKEFFWVVYAVLVSFLGFLFLTGHIKVPAKAPAKASVKIALPEPVEETESPEDIAVEDSQTEEENPLEEEYNELANRNEELEKTLGECQAKLATEEETKLAIIHEYGKQMKEIKEKYQPLINYNVKNFEAQYDTGGSKEIQDTNQIVYGIGELSKYTPWGITINMFSSMALDNSKAEYEVMVDANSAFGTGMQTTIVDTKAEMEKFIARMDFYEKLLEDSENDSYASFTDERLKKIWENQYLMKYLLDDQALELEPYADEVCKKLYIMGAATLTLKDYYETLLTDCDSKTNSLNKLESQYEEIMEVIDCVGVDRIEEMVTKEDLMYYLSPLIRAGAQAENEYTTLVASPLVDSTFKYTRMGRAYWYFKEEITIFHSDTVQIYYAAGKPTYINGYYFYNGQILNGDGSEEAAILYNEAIWLITGYHDDKRECERHMQNLMDACGNQ